MTAVAMDHLTAEQIETLRSRLLAERATLLGLLPDATAALVDAGQPDVGDIQDAAATEAASLTAHTLAEREQARLAEVEAALQRLRDGSYGLCEVTDDPIPAARLLAEPTARTTVEAQAQLERERAQLGADPDDLRRAY
jgi:DnaK suppressor protein